MDRLKIIGSEEVERAEELVVLNIERLGRQIVTAIRDHGVRGLLDDGCPRLTELSVLGSRRRPRSSPVAAAVRVAAVHMRWTVVVHGCDVVGRWWRWVG